MESENKKYLFISVKPEFANKIITKEKSIELRKTKPNVKIGDNIIIYASSPLKAVVGYGVIKKIITRNPEQMWNEYAELLGIDKERYDEYYSGKDRAIGIEIYNITKIEPISLNNLRVLDPNFHPPQIYRYVSNSLICRSIIQYLSGNNLGANS